MNGGLLVVAGTAIFLSAYFTWHYYGERVRRRMFAARAMVSGKEWFVRYYPVPESDQTDVEEILHALALDLGVQWTQLRPDDDISATIRLPKCFGTVDGEFSSLDATVEDWANAKGIDLTTLPRFEGRLGEYLDGIRASARLPASAENPRQSSA